MANRSLAAKAERATRQRRDAARAEFLKPAYLTGKQAVPAYDAGRVKVLGCGEYVAPEGRGHRVAARRTYGDGTRGWLDVRMCQSFESRLIKRQ